MIRIVTDSTCEGPDELLKHPALEVVPLSVVFGQEVLRDRIDITTAQFWERLPKARPLPTTSQITPGDFLQSFRRHTDAGDEVVAITLSSKLSGTYESAVMARDDLAGRPIDVIDSLSISVGLGLMVQEALEMAQSGASRSQIVARVRAMRAHVHLLFVLETLEYLQKGGRIGRAQAFMGTLLKFKPILGLKDGEVYPVARVRTKRNAVETMLKSLYTEVAGGGSRVKLGVAEACAREEAQLVADQLSKRFDSPHVFISTLGPVIGVHVGPGTIGAAVYAGPDGE